MRFVFLTVLVYQLLSVTSPDTATTVKISDPPTGATTGASRSKSPKLAFVMSLVIPGLGELYSGAMVRAASFMTVEALTWINYARWRSKGENLKANFRQFANNHWIEAHYRSWQVYNNNLSSNSSRKRREKYLETETLPTKTEDIQQYYELIGKYDQFVYGWDDVWNPDFPEANAGVQSVRRLNYEIQRNESNKFLKRASVIVGLAVLNRILSAIHASIYTQSLENQIPSNSIQFNLYPSTPYNHKKINLFFKIQF